MARTESGIRYTPPKKVATKVAPKKATIAYYADPKKSASPIETKKPETRAQAQPASQTTTQGVGVLGTEKPTWMPNWMWTPLEKKNQQINDNRAMNQAATAAMSTAAPAPTDYAERMARNNPQPLPEKKTLGKFLSGKTLGAKNGLEMSPVTDAFKSTGRALSRVGNTVGKGATAGIQRTAEMGNKRISDEQRDANYQIRTGQGAAASSALRYQGMANKAATDSAKDAGQTRPPSVTDNPNWRNENANILMTTDEYIKRNNARLSVSNPNSPNYNPQSPFYSPQMDDYYEGANSAAAQGKSMFEYQQTPQGNRPPAYWEPMQQEYMGRQNGLNNTSNPFSPNYNPSSPQYSPAVEQYYRDMYEAAERGEDMYEWQKTHGNPQRLAWVPFGSGYVAKKDAGQAPAPQDTGGGTAWVDYGGGGWSPQDYNDWQMRMLEWNIGTNRSG